MNGKNKRPELSIEEGQIRELLNAHWQASAVGDVNAEHDIYDDYAICDYPQSGERILGRRNLQALRSHSRQVSISGEFLEKVIFGSPNTRSTTRGNQHTQ